MLSRPAIFVRPGRRRLRWLHLPTDVVVRDEPDSSKFLSLANRSESPGDLLCRMIASARLRTVGTEIRNCRDNAGQGQAIEKTDQPRRSMISGARVTS